LLDCIAEQRRYVPTAKQPGTDHRMVRTDLFALVCLEHLIVCIRGKIAVEAAFATVERQDSDVLKQACQKNLFFAVEQRRSGNGVGRDGAQQGSTPDEGIVDVARAGLIEGVDQTTATTTPPKFTAAGLFSRERKATRVPVIASHPEGPLR